MVKREAAMRAAKARVINSAPKDTRVKSVFITQPVGTPALSNRSNSMTVMSNDITSKETEIFRPDSFKWIAQVRSLVVVRHRLVYQASMHIITITNVWSAGWRCSLIRGSLG